MELPPLFYLLTCAFGINSHWLRESGLTVPEVEAVVAAWQEHGHYEIQLCPAWSGWNANQQQLAQAMISHVVLERGLVARE